LFLNFPIQITLLDVQKNCLALILDYGLIHVKMNIMDTKYLSNFDITRQSPSFLRHRKQRFWQIFMPIILGSVITLAAGVLLVLTLTGTVNVGNLSQMAATSTIWLLLPVMVLGVFLTFFLLGLIYLAARVLDILPQYTFLVAQYAALVEAKIKLWTAKGASPLIGIKSIGAAVSAFFKYLLSWMK
jgi:hypothetical protein